MAAINPYLTFNGNCREAITFYHQCFGGDLEINPFRGSPMAEQMPEDQLDHIMHANIIKGDFVLMASDGMQDPEPIFGNVCSLSLNCTSESEIDNLFAKLSTGGEVTMPLKDQFWGAKFGMIVDQFGIKWMLNFDRVTK